MSKHTGKKVNFAIVGCGRISAKHVRAIQSMKAHINLVAFCDIDVKKTANYKKIYKDATVYKNYSDLLLDTNIDAISICAPSGLHAMMTLEAIKAGKDVLVEKPIALNVKDAIKIEEAANSMGCHVLPVMQNRFNDPIKLVKKWNKKCGRLLQIDASVFWYRPQQYYNDGIHGTSKMDGGVLMNQGIHYVDMINFFMESQPHKVFAAGGTIAHKMECEDTIILTLIYSDGRFGCLRANTISYPQNFEGSVTLFYEKATIKISGTALNNLEYWSGKGSPKEDERNHKNSQDVYGNGHEQVYKNYYNFKIKKEKRYITVGEAIGSIKIIEAAYKSLIKGKPVSV